MNKLSISLILILIFGTLNAQKLTPLELVEKVFTDKTFAENKLAYSTGEYKGKPNANDVKKNMKLNFKLLNQRKNYVVVNLTIADSLNDAQEIYVHLI